MAVADPAVAIEGPDHKVAEVVEALPSLATTAQAMAPLALDPLPPVAVASAVAGALQVAPADREAVRIDLLKDAAMCSRAMVRCRPHRIQVSP